MADLNYPHSLNILDKIGGVCGGLRQFYPRPPQGGWVALFFPEMRYPDWGAQGWIILGTVL